VLPTLIRAALRHHLHVAAAFTVLLLSAGCAGTATAPSGYAPYSQSDIVVGSGREAISGLTVTMNYTGWVYDPDRADNRGAQFDSSVGKAPFSFVLGSGTVIRGWEQGVPGMKVGGVRQLIIPPSLAYGDSRQGIIPPNATLLFHIELVDVR
jgi:FKBP-type peptidyl-prolyl cis-trans isomerase FkpA